MRRWREVRCVAVASPWKDSGVYLITGGTGGLGLLLAERIAASARRPVLWLTSRSAPSVEAQARLSKLDATVVHRCVDVAHAAAVAALVAEHPPAGRSARRYRACGRHHARQASRATRARASCATCWRPRSLGSPRSMLPAADVRSRYDAAVCVGGRRARKCGSGGLCGGERLHGCVRRGAERARRARAAAWADACDRLALLARRRNGDAASRPSMRWSAFRARARWRQTRPLQRSMRRSLLRERAGCRRSSCWMGITSACGPRSLGCAPERRIACQAPASESIAPR